MLPWVCSGPNLPEESAAAGGVLGYISSSLLADLVTVWVAVPLLILLAVFGLLITGIPVSEFPARIQRARAAIATARPKKVPEYGTADRAYDTPIVSVPEPEEDFLRTTWRSRPSQWTPHQSKQGWLPHLWFPMITR